MLLSLFFCGWTQCCKKMLETVTLLFSNVSTVFLKIMGLETSEKNYCFNLCFPAPLILFNQLQLKNQYTIWEIHLHIHTRSIVSFLGHAVQTSQCLRSQGSGGGWGGVRGPESGHGETEAGKSRQQVTMAHPKPFLSSSSENPSQNVIFKEIIL